METAPAPAPAPALTLEPDISTSFITRDSRMHPSAGWTVRISRDADMSQSTTSAPSAPSEPSRYTTTLEPPREADGSVVKTSAGCVAVDFPKRGKTFEEACPATMLLDTAGTGRAWAVCARHGTRSLTWSDAMYHAAIYERHGVLSNTEYTRMIVQRCDMRKGRTEEELDRVERWIEDGEIARVD